MYSRLVFCGLCFLPMLGFASDVCSRLTIETLITEQLQSWESGDTDSFLNSLHDEVIFAYPGKRLDKTDSLEVFHFWKENFEKTKVYIHRILIEGSYFSVEYQFATTRKETGIRTVTGTVTVGAVKDGKIIEWKEYLDGRVSRMQAKGELPIDEGAVPFPWPESLPKSD